MESKTLVKQIEVLANFLENEGLVREAYNLDMCLNSIDTGSKDASNTPGLQQVPNFQGKPLLQGQLQQIFNQVLATLNNVVVNMRKVHEYDPKKLESINLKFKELFARQIRPLLSAIQNQSEDIKTKVDNILDLVENR